MFTRIELIESESESVRIWSRRARFNACRVLYRPSYTILFFRILLYRRYQMLSEPVEQSGDVFSSGMSAQMTREFPQVRFSISTATSTVVVSIIEMPILLITL